MARRFDLLDSEVRPQYPGQMASYGQRYKEPDTFDQRFGPYDIRPSQEMIRRLFEEEQFRQTPGAVPPGYRERFGDPTKVISENDPISTMERMNEIQRRRLSVPPPGPAEGSLAGRRYAQAAASATDVPPSAWPSLPAGARVVDEWPALPEGAKVVEESKASRFLSGVKPEGPISGLIALMRLSGQAAQGRAPELITRPEAAIPEAIQGMVAGTGARAVGRLPIAEAVPPRMTTPEALVPPPQISVPPKQLTYQPAKPTLEQSRIEARRMGAEMQSRGEVQPYEPGGPAPAIRVPPEEGQVPPPSPLLSPQQRQEFAAVRKGVELKERLNPESAQNLSAREQALQTALQPHINTIMGVGRRTQAPITALESAVPEDVLSGALQSPPKAASVASWLRVYEAAARAKFSPQAKASLDLATRNLNNNLGTDLTLKDVLGGQ